MNRECGARKIIPQFYLVHFVGDENKQIIANGTICERTPGDVCVCLYVCVCMVNRFGKLYGKQLRGCLFFLALFLEQTQNTTHKCCTKSEMQTRWLRVTGKAALKYFDKDLGLTLIRRKWCIIQRVEFPLAKIEGLSYPFKYAILGTDKLNKNYNNLHNDNLSTTYCHIVICQLFSLFS